MSDDQPRRLIPKGRMCTPSSILDDIKHSEAQIKEIYVVVNWKDGNHDHYVAGDLKGLAFARQVLEKYAMEEM